MNSDSIYTSQVNDAEGYTNGFYFGKPGQLSKILNRWDDFENSNHDYEFALKKSFLKYNIHREATDIVFWKIRANGIISWQGGARTDWLDDKEAKRIRHMYDEMVVSSLGTALVCAPHMERMRD